MLLASGFSPVVEVEGFAWTVAPEPVSRDLHLPAGSTVLEIRRRHLLESKPLAYAVIYVPETIGRSLTQEEVQRLPIYTIYEQRLGIRLGRATQHIRAVGASQSVADALGTCVGTPTLSAQWVTTDITGVPVEWINIFYRADLYKFVIGGQRNGAGDPPILTTTYSELAGSGDEPCESEG